MLLVAVVIMLAFDRVMNRTMLGKAMRAVAHSGAKWPA
jgi:branched-chain amino acid transport system permease protein